VKPSERYRRDADDLEAFREAYVHLLALDESPGWRGTKTWLGRREAVARASGPAAGAFERHGVDGVLGGTNPVAQWMDSLESYGVSPADVLSSVDAAIARAGRASDDASRREEGLTGVVASFVRWPSTLREAVDPGKVGQRRAAAAVGYTAQALVVGVIASIIGTLVYQLLFG
jgi:hypothetical protein